MLTHSPCVFTRQFYAGFNVHGPYIEVKFPFQSYSPIGAGFNMKGPYIDDEFPGWFFGSPYLGPGPFYW